MQAHFFWAQAWARAWFLSWIQAGVPGVLSFQCQRCRQARSGRGSIFVKYAGSPAGRIVYPCIQLVQPDHGILNAQIVRRKYVFPSRPNISSISAVHLSTPFILVRYAITSSFSILFSFRRSSPSSIAKRATLCTYLVFASESRSNEGLQGCGEDSSSGRASCLHTDSGSVYE